MINKPGGRDPILSGGDFDEPDSHANLFRKIGSNTFFTGALPFASDYYPAK